ncbi:hypothetical protein ACT4RO_11390 [Ornithobacterium rhinotracheale]|uniref:hypothetical protein n=3 Tax=Ornithobacterium rhinotracheale TaxID=28251 RepID=UPI00129C481B|nr:hypothetical protein [Ornithobacterium rhinotracheale]UOH77296.1 hypothetical protein MT996_08760 [Ornithobacterium rhinotracheale]UOH78780.1 hypothetical protein MT996_04725 [Ornithobacterium rhinotracheale]
MLTDKVLHSIVGIAITFVVAYCLLLLDYSWWKALLIGYAATIVFACTNELRDYLAYGLFDWRDILATLNPIVFVKYLIKLKL